MERRSLAYLHKVEEDEVAFDDLRQKRIWHGLSVSSIPIVSGKSVEGSTCQEHTLRVIEAGTQDFVHNTQIRATTNRRGKDGPEFSHRFQTDVYNTVGKSRRLLFSSRRLPQFTKPRPKGHYHLLQGIRRCYDGYDISEKEKEVKYYDKVDVKYFNRCVAESGHKVRPYIDISVRSLTVATEEYRGCQIL